MQNLLILILTNKKISYTTLKCQKHQDISKTIPENIIRDINKGITTRRGAQNLCAFSAFLSQVEPNNAKEVILDENFILAMQEKLQ